MSETKELAVVEDAGEFGALMDTSKFEQCWRVSKMFSCSDLVPEQFRGKPENCFIAMQLAVRMKIDPFGLMQSMYVVHGRPGIEAKLAIALMNKRGPFSGPIQWRFEGEGDKRQCTAYATHATTGEVCESTVTWEMVKAEGWDKPKGKPGGYQQPSKWTTLPDLMFRYRSAMFLARLYCPEVLLGLSDVDELRDAITVEGERIIDQEPPKSRTEQIKERLRKPAPTSPEQSGTQTSVSSSSADAPAVSGPTYMQPTLHDCLGLVHKGDYDLAVDLSRGLTTIEQSEVESQIARAHMGSQA